MSLLQQEELDVNLKYQNKVTDTQPEQLSRKRSIEESDNNEKTKKIRIEESSIEKTNVRITVNLMLLILT